MPLPTRPSVGPGIAAAMADSGQPGPAGLFFAVAPITVMPVLDFHRYLDGLSFVDGPPSREAIGARQVIHRDTVAAGQY